MMTDPAKAGERGKLPTNLLSALQDVSRCHGSPYWWREASMKKLEAMGFVEKYCPPSVAERPRMKARPWRVTSAGLAAKEVG